MGIDDTQETRLVTGGMPSDDPAWGQVSAFLDTVASVYPDGTTAALEATHVAAAAREARLVRGGLQLDRRKTMKDLFTFKTHRLLVGSIAAALMLSAGVGVASAMGVGPLQHLLPAAPASADPTPEPTDLAPTPSVEPTEDESDDPAKDDDEQDDRTPKATPASTHSSDAGDDDSDGPKAHDSKDDGDDENADEDDQGDDESADSDDQGDDDSGDDDSDSGEHHKGGDDGDRGGDDNGGDQGSDD